MIDLHTHILPGIDDGADDFAEAVEMCRLSAADGVRTIVATPHQRHPSFWNDDRPALEALCRELAEQDDLGLEVKLGSEISLSSESLDEIDQLPEGDLLTLCGGHYLLLELDWRGLGPDPIEVVHEVTVLGWRPIIAHPERVAWLASDLDRIAALVEHGAAMQLTAMSLTGAFGSKLRERSLALLDEGLVQIVASDAHDLRHRPPGLSAARAVVAERCGEAFAQALFEDNPLAVIEDRPLPPQPAIERPAGFGARLRRLAGR